MELPNIAAYAYQDVHVWSALLTCLPPPPPWEGPLPKEWGQSETVVGLCEANKLPSPGFLPFGSSGFDRVLML